MKKAVNILLIISIVLFNLFFVVKLVFRIVYPKTNLSAFESASNETGVDVYLLLSIAKVESSFNEKAKSSAGAIGIMQIKKESAKFICEITEEQFMEELLFDADYNIKLGSKYFKYLFDKFDNLKTALAAYNAGEGNVAKWLKHNDYSKDGKNLDKIPFKETAEYVRKIIKAYSVYKYLK